MWEQIYGLFWWIINGVAANHFAEEVKDSVWVWLFLVGFHILTGTLGLFVTFIKNLESLSYTPPLIVLLSSIVGMSLSVFGNPTSTAGFVYAIWSLALTLLWFPTLFFFRYLIRRRLYEQAKEEALERILFTPLDSETLNALAKGGIESKKAIMRLATGEKNKDESTK